MIYVTNRSMPGIYRGFSTRRHLIISVSLDPPIACPSSIESNKLAFLALLTSAMDVLLLATFILHLITSGVQAWCPPMSSVPSIPRNTLSTPRALNENCCQSDGASCSCGSGLQCCANNDFRFLCVFDPCDPNPCGNGVCATNNDGSRRCFCAIGTVQDRNGLCAEDPCFRNPCGRGGRCSPSFFGSGNQYNCRCSGDQIFDGKTCVANTCNRLRCGRGRCHINNRRRAVCDCVPGFRFDGRSCIRDDPCRTHTCGAGGHCSEVNRRAVCRCNIGFRLDSFTKACVTDDPCSGVNCGRGTCARSGPTRAVCNCDIGFTFDFSTRTCVQDRSQLTTTSQPATVNTEVRARLGGTCSATTCTCDVGFQHNRRTNTCQVSNPCQASSSQSTFTLGDRGSGTIAQGTTSGCLKSPDFPQPYPNDLFDEVVIPTERFSQLTITIQEMQIQTSGGNSQGFVQNNCFSDYLFISGQLFCGSLTPPAAHRVITINVQGRAEVIVGMGSDSDTSFQGFLLKWQLS